MRFSYFIIAKGCIDMRLKKDLVLRKIAGENIVVPIGRLSQISPMMQITSSAAWLWEEMKKDDFTEESLVEAVMNHFSGVTREQAKADVHSFLELLDGNYMLDNGKPEPKIGRVKIQLTEKQIKKMKENMKK